MIRLESAPVLASIITAIVALVGVHRRREAACLTDPMSEEERAKALDVAASSLGEPTDWRVSVVDLLKILRLDSSPENRRRLADELGYHGVYGTVIMNQWLHDKLLEKIAEHNLPV